jgi:Fe-S-cluster containining protein
MKYYFIERNLATIKRFATIREDENYRFRAFLKSRDPYKVDAIVHRLHKEITPKIDCSSCGNCCNMQATLSKEEVETLAKLENITAEEYLANYCVIGFGSISLKEKPCRYLQGTKCSIYDIQPVKCKTFPYTDKQGFTSRSLGMLSFYEYCPIVYNLMERLKEEMGFRR